ncbi:MAG: type II secretion system protein [Clostridiaceae bacterium]
MKKGFTLIECIISISIVGIMVGLVSISIESYKKIENDIKISNTNNGIFYFINTYKKYCMIQECSGSINFDVSNDKITFVSNGKQIDEYIFLDGIDLYNPNLINHKMNIDNKGYSSNAFTLKYRDSMKKLHTITFSVGVDYAEIKY